MPEKMFLFAVLPYDKLIEAVKKEGFNKKQKKRN